MGIRNITIASEKETHYYLRKFLQEKGLGIELQSGQIALELPAQAQFFLDCFKK